ncbi:MAG: DUF1800 domain-containing protein [Gammaproteobacteria bacterium]|nr:DUF1800 domain-containing protein [Gammaproteobacteria bacterium]
MKRLHRHRALLLISISVLMSACSQEGVPLFKVEIAESEEASAEVTNEVPTTAIAEGEAEQAVGIDSEGSGPSLGAAIDSALIDEAASEMPPETDSTNSEESSPDESSTDESSTEESSTTSSEESTVVDMTINEDYVTDLDTVEEVSRFFMQAGFGATMPDIESWVGKNASQWMSDQFSKGRGRSYVKGIELAFPGNLTPSGRPASQLFWQSMIKDNDQLRNRMVYALSQIIVASDVDIGKNGSFRMAYYVDLLDKHAFGNYRDLLYDITHSPMMAKYLTYLRNRKANERTGREPDENYAREIMQLFSIGLIQLNLDGTPKLDANGSTIETYTNDDVVGLSRVFTGLSYNRSEFFSKNTIPDEMKALKMFEDQHSEKEKAFLGTVIPAGTSGKDSINIAIDTLFNHPNVAPFIARQLIQRFTESAPSPEYVRRVATAFESGTFLSEDGTAFGSGSRGDLTATIAAILLDASAHIEPAGAADLTAGKVREPVLRFVQMLRAFDAKPVDIISLERSLYDTSSATEKLAQHPMRPRSVFNFYRPGFVAPNSNSGEAGLTTPELQIVNEGSALGFLNFITKYAVQRSKNPGSEPSLVPDYNAAVQLANNPESLVSYLNTLLTGGALSDFDAVRIEEIVNSIVIEEKSEQNDRLSRVYAAVVAVMVNSANATL